MYFVMVTRRTYVTFCSGVMVKKSSQGRKLQMSDRIPTGEIMSAQIFRFLKISQKRGVFAANFEFLDDNFSTRRFSHHSPTAQNLAMGGGCCPLFPYFLPLQDATGVVTFCVCSGGNRYWNGAVAV